MKISAWRTLLGAVTVGFSLATPIQAAVVTFEDVNPAVDPVFAFFGSSVSSGGFKFTDDDPDALNTTGGFIAIDSAAALNPAPPNASGQFLYLANSAGVVMTAESGLGFLLSSFDVAFLSPVPGLAGTLPGMLTVELFDLFGVKFATETFALPSGASGGDFPFATMSLSNTTTLSQVNFFSCAYQESGDCERFGLLPAQFALDNFVEADITAVVPTPGSAVLALSALAVLASRRKIASVRGLATSTRS